MTSTSSRRSSTRLVAGGLLALVLGAATLVDPAGAVSLVDPSDAATPGPRALQERARELLADPGFQRVPAAEAEPLPPPEAPPEAPEAPAPAVRLPAPRWRLPALFSLAAFGLVPILFYVFLAVMLVLLALWLVKEAGRRRSRRTPTATRREAADEARAAAARPDEAPGDAHRLAAEGRYAEAVHALLLAAIRLLAARSPNPPPASRTSRELARLLPLGPEARAAFGELVAAVERSLFGGAPVARQDFEAGLARFRAVVGSRS